MANWALELNYLSVHCAKVHSAEFCSVLFGAHTAQMCVVSRLAWGWHSVCLISSAQPWSGTPKSAIQSTVVRAMSQCRAVKVSTKLGSCFAFLLIELSPWSLSVSLSVCLSALTVCLFLSLSRCLSWVWVSGLHNKPCVSVSLCLSLSLSLCLSVSVSVSLSLSLLSLSLSLSLPLSLYLSVSLSFSHTLLCMGQWPSQ